MKSKRAMKKNFSLILFAMFWILTFMMNHILHERSVLWMNIVLLFYLTNIFLVLYSIVKIFSLTSKKDYSNMLFPMAVVLTNLLFLLYGVCKLFLKNPLDGLE